MIFFTVNPKYNLKVLPLETWVIFFTIVCFSRLVEFFASLKKILLDDARIYLETRKMRLENQAQPENLTDAEQRTVQLATIEMNNEECTSYFKRIRMYGEGEVRIN